MTQVRTSKSTLTAMNMIYFSLVSIMTFFGLIVLLLNYTGGINTGMDKDFALMLRYILFALLPGGMAAGYFIFKQSLASVNQNLSLKDKLVKYQTALLIRSACLELPGLFGAVAALITGDNSFLLFTAIIIVLFFLFRPTVYSITNDLNLSQGERTILENPQSPLN
jgi:hypothetical protein